MIKHNERSKPGSKKPTGQVKGKERWQLRLFVAGHTPKAVNAFKNIKTICDKMLKGKYHIEVVDLRKKPKSAHDNQILALPALIRNSPLPVRNIIGDLSDTERVLTGLGLKERK